MMQVETAVLATMVRSQRKELGLTRAQCTAAGGPSAATLAAVEQGRLTNPTDTVLTQLDTALQWPAGTAQTATLAPAAAIAQSTTAPATLVQHKLLYNELVARATRI
ncbi:helix-turn-helix domain-containing protein [Mycolicibacterium fortuitum]|nr:helix-turn-helix domain-containing protein [Mycolicibacterium fortuitum]